MQTARSHCDPKRDTGPCRAPASVQTAGEAKQRSKTGAARWCVRGIDASQNKGAKRRKAPRRPAATMIRRPPEVTFNGRSEIVTHPNCEPLRRLRSVTTDPRLARCPDPDTRTRSFGGACGDRFTQTCKKASPPPHGQQQCAAVAHVPPVSQSRAIGAGASPDKQHARGRRQGAAAVMHNAHRLAGGREAAPAARHHAGEAGVRIAGRLRDAVWRLANAAPRHSDRQQ